MFTIYFDPQTGSITDYKEDPVANTDAVPNGRSSFSFANIVPGMFNSNGLCLMKVDVQSQKLVLINPVQIPEPLPNPPNAATL